MPDDGSKEIKMRWYVVHARTGEEIRVVERLRSRIKSRGKDMEAKFGEIVVPTEEVMEIRAGQKRKSERKFFPGYVLVQMMMDPVAWHFIKEVPGVIGFIGSKNPTPISDQQVEAILRRVEEGVMKPKHKVLFEPGEMVRVIDGPFADFNGVVEDVNYEKNRLRVSVVIFGRSTPVELEFSQVEKA